MWSFRRFIHKVRAFAKVLPIPCERRVAVAGEDPGIYKIDVDLGEDIGGVLFNYDADTIPDRFQVYYDGVLVADSKFVGDGISGMPPSFPGLLGSFTLPVFEYDGVAFQDTGTTENITVIQADIANGTTEPTAGEGFRVFDKLTSTPTVATIVVTGVFNDTGWRCSLSCPKL